MRLGGFEMIETLQVYSLCVPPHSANVRVSYFTSMGALLC